MNYRIGLLVDGLMEDPCFRVENVRDIESSSPHEAKEIWADLTGVLTDPRWDSASKTYFGWKLVEIKDL